MFDPKRLWVVEAELIGTTSWLVIADSEDEAKDAAEEDLRNDVAVEWDATPALIKDGKLLTHCNMGDNDDVIIADYVKDDEITLSELQELIADWHRQQQRIAAERDNGQIELSLD